MVITGRGAILAISESFLQELKYRCEIESIVSKYVNLRKSGRGFVGLCPFHSEKTPSFHVYSDNQNFFCFGCETGGDVINFIRKIENLEYIEAIHFLAKQAGIEVPEDDVDDGAAVIKTKILEINRKAALFFYKSLFTKAGKRGLEYFNKRRLSATTIKGFGLGFAPDGWELIDYLKAEGYSDEEIYASTLSARSKNGGYYSVFRNRVMFPIIDLRGNVIAFGGRVLDDSKPKYLNSNDTPVFKKSRCLYALNFAKNGNNSSMILCEGYMDAIALHQAGFKNAIATLGTAITPEQSRLMARYTKEVTISYDADIAGQKASQRAISLLTEAGLSVRVLHIEGGKDPDEFIKTFGADKFRLMLEKSGNHIEYRLNEALAKYDIDITEQKALYLKEAAKILATVESSIERDVYSGRLSQMTGVAKESILADVSKLVGGHSVADKKAKLKAELDATTGFKDRLNPEKSRYLKASRAEENLLLLLLNNPDYLKKIDELIKPDDFITNFNKKIYTAVRQEILTFGEADLTRLGGNFTTEEMSRITAFFLTRQVSNTLEEARDCIEVIHQERLNASITSNSQSSGEELLDAIKKNKLKS